MSGGKCHKKGEERGLQYEIEVLEDIIGMKEEMGKDASYEKELLQAYRDYSPEDYNRMLNGQA